MTQNTAVILVDPLNDFIHPDGKIYHLVKASIEATDAVRNMTKLVKGARKLGIPVYYGLHQRYQEGHYDGWQHMNKSHQGNKRLQVFKDGSWGGEIHAEMKPDLENGDVVVSKHWNSSSFANTDLDYQLSQRDITHVVCAGMVANTCLEATARYALELGYEVTIIKDATAGFSTQLKDVAAEVVWPTIMEEVLTVDEWIARGKNKATSL